MPTPEAARGRSQWRTAATALSLAVGLTLSLWTGLAAWSGEAQWSWLLTVGAGAGALLIAHGLARLTPGGRQLSFCLYLVLALCLPLYGVLGSLALYAALRSGRGGRLAGEYADYVSAAEAGTDGETPHVRGSLDQRVWHELNVQSYMDVMRGPDRNLKKSLIGKILGEWTPNSVALLREALLDEEYEIRSYACTALTEIENRINAGILRQRRKVEGAAADPEDRLDLVRAYLDYAQSGLLDSASAAHYAGMARDVLTHTDTDAFTGDRRRLVLLLSGQLARLQGDGAAERQAYERLLGQWPDDREALLHKCALDFRERRLADLRRGATAFAAQIPEDHPARAAAALWADRGDGASP